MHLEKYTSEFRNRANVKQKRRGSPRYHQSNDLNSNIVEVDSFHGCTETTGGDGKIQGNG